MTEPPSDATRFATRPKQRAKENLNATDNEMAKLRKESVAAAVSLLGGPKFGEDWNPELAHTEMVAGMWRQWAVEDHRTLDPETVRDGFDRSMREHTAAVYNRAVIRAHGLVYP